ncbi:Conserved_hypothetical protein [Hexamita inflata]|uniref:Transmembrane protein n=1 Tax=Hexamita inflata TaxID=28002 RepID=A0AA86PFH2_9EUKA|nr:Conserved hypothetical protein [Hexamita inflata]
MKEESKLKCKRIGKKIMVLAILIGLSPIIIVVGSVALMFKAIVTPIQVILNNKLLKQYNSARKNKQLVTNQLPKQNEDNYQQRIEQLMCVFKPVKSLDLFFSINNGNIEILNKDLDCLYQQPIKYKFSPGQVESYCYSLEQKQIFKAKINEITYQVPQHINLCICREIIYFSVLDLIFTISDNFDVQLVLQIPDYGRNRTGEQIQVLKGNQLMSLQNKLYISNNTQKLYEITKNNKLRCLTRKNKEFFYPHFCDQVYAVNQYCVYKYTNDLQHQRIFEIQNFNIVFSLGGTLVLSSNEQHTDDNQNCFYILNMLDAKVVATRQNEINLSKAMIPYQLELGPTGIQLKEEILIKLFGADFPVRMYNYYWNYLNAQLGTKLQNKFYKFLFDSKTDILVSQKFTSINRQFNQLKNNISQQTLQITNKLNGIAQKCNQFINKINYAFDEQSIQ